MTDNPSERPQTTDIIDRINLACIGHPYALIPWPYRLLHDARSEIEQLRQSINNALAMMRNPHDGGEHEDGEVPAVDVLRAALMDLGHD